MPARRLGFMMAALFLAAWPCLAQAGSGAYFVPYGFFPGDAVELRFAVDPALISANANAKLRTPEDTETLEFIDLRPLRQGSSAFLSLRFKSWAAGPFTIPAVTYGGKVFGPWSGTTLSFLKGERKKLRPERPSLSLPGARTFYIITFGGVALLVVAAWLSLSVFMPYFMRVRQRRLSLLPYRKFQHERRIMARRLPAPDGRVFYGMLARSFRRFLEARLSPGIGRLTPPELRSFGAEALGDYAPAAAEILARADGVRFGGEASSREDRECDLASVAEMVEAIERRQEEQHAGV
jgi:hypothetical protein